MRLLCVLFVLSTLCICHPALAQQDATWSASWIGPSNSVSYKAKADQWICYRKSFELSEQPQRAIARIAVDSRYFLWVNGKLAVFEGGLKRGPNPKDTYFDHVNLGKYLHVGNNTIAALQCFWGTDGFSHKSSGLPGFLFEMHAAGANVVSDATWKWLPHPAFGHVSGKMPNFRISERPIHFDARADAILGWQNPDFNDAAWANGLVLGAPPCAPWNSLRLRPIPQWKDYGLSGYKSLKVSPPAKDGSTQITAALPYNCQITPYLKVTGAAAKQITINTDDPLNEIYTEYVTKAGTQEFETPAWMNGHHVIYTIPAGVQVLALKYRETGYSTEFTGRFTCDSPELNTLWEKCRRTLYITMRDNFMDCPDRERGQWWGDAVNEIGETFYSLSPTSSLLARKGIYNLMEWQRPDGSIFSPVPAGNWSSELPDQMLASVGQYGFWNYVLYTGDKETAQFIYPRLLKYLDLWKVGQDGLVVHRAGEWDWIDWGDNIDARVLDNAWYCLALQGAANIAKLMGDSAHANSFSAEREGIIASARRLLWNGNAYLDPLHKGPPDDRANGLAVVAGIAEPEKYDAISKVLTDQQWASPYMEKYVLEALMLMHRADLAVARMKVRYQPAIASELTTLPETFPMGGTSNHAWSGGPLTILSQYFAGIAPMEPGFKTYKVAPQMGPLKEIHGTVDTVRGKIDLSLARTHNKLEIRLNSPNATIAELQISDDYGKSFTIGGHKISASNWKNFRGVSGFSHSGTLTTIRLSPGKWNVISN